jgi:divalent metal cation (Fe/Co/Zn/Cd) transporter
MKITCNGRSNQISIASPKLKNRPQEQVQADVQKVVSSFEAVESLVHFTCHYLNRKLFVEMEIRMKQNSLQISEARIVAEHIREDVLRLIPDIHQIDIHLEILEEATATATSTDSLTR